MFHQTRQPVPSLRRLFFATLLGVLVCFAGLAHAQKPTAAKPKPTAAKPKPAAAKPKPATKPAAERESDLDRSLMGEFSGPIAIKPNQYQPLALQVRCLGNGNFEAVQLSGGLPGERTYRGQPVAFEGKRSGDLLVLSGGPWAIFVEKDHCLVIDRTGKRVGRLERVVRQSPTMGAQPPKDAIVLFDGTDTKQFTNGKMTEDGLLIVGADLKPLFQDFNLHLEFKLPYMPTAQAQTRANSGIYLQSRYEVQVLDSFGTPPLVNGCGSLYKFRQPDVNLCLPPLVWQTYDIVFTSPRWASDGTKWRNARITVWHNGVKIHDDLELPNKTGAGAPEEPTFLPIRLQDHGDAIRYRNIWLIDRGLTPATKFPVHAKAVHQKTAKPDPRP